MPTLHHKTYFFMKNWTITTFKTEKAHLNYNAMLFFPSFFASYWQLIVIRVAILGAVLFYNSDTLLQGFGFSNPLISVSLRLQHGKS